MKIYLLSAVTGILVGIIYSLLNIRSPAPPLVALVGLLGILFGEQTIPVGKQLILGSGFASAWQEARSAANSLGWASRCHADACELSEDVPREKRK